MEDKVESFNDYIIKYNTSKYSHGLEWFTELLSINHKRELRVYNWYNEKSHQSLLIPSAYELNNKYIKIEKLLEVDSNEIHVSDLIPSIKEFALLGIEKRINLYDLFSSPTQSVLRGLIRNAKFLGTKVIFQAIKHLSILYTKKPKDCGTYLIHKDLKIDQNMISTKKGIYFIDFGSSILTKYYFLTDIVELSTDHFANKVNFDLLETFIKEIGLDNLNIEYLRSQIFLLLLRRYLHFPAVDRANELKMANVKEFLDNLDALVATFKLKQ